MIRLIKLKDNKKTNNINIKNFINKNKENINNIKSINNYYELNINNEKNINNTYELNIIIEKYISLESINLLLNIYNKLINNNFNNIKIYCNNINYSELKKFNYSYIFNINDLNIDNLKKKYFYSDSIYNNIKLKNLNEYFYNLNGKNENFIDIQKNYLEQYLDKNIYEENNLYNIIVKKIFEYTNYIKNKFSIIIPLYNSELYIIHTLNSIYHQDNINDINFEVIIVNDNSTDNSIKIIKEYITNKNINNINIIYNEENKGAYYSRNRGIFYSTGEFILFFDSDDLLPKSRLINDYNDFLSNNNIELVCSKFIRYNCDNDYNLMIIDKYKKTVNGFYRQMSVSYRRNFFYKTGFFVDNKFGSDSEFYDRVLKSTNKKMSNRLGYKALFHDSKSDHLTRLYNRNSRNKFKNYYKCCLKNNISLLFNIRLLKNETLTTNKLFIKKDKIKLLEEEIKRHVILNNELLKELIELGKKKLLKILNNNNKNILYEEYMVDIKLNKEDEKEIIKNDLIEEIELENKKLLKELDRQNILENNIEKLLDEEIQKHKILNIELLEEVKEQKILEEKLKIINNEIIKNK